MIWLVVLSVIVLCLFVSGLFSGSETGLYCLNRLRVELGARAKHPRALRLERLLADEQGALSVILVGTNVANYLATSAIAYLFATLMGMPGRDAELYTVALATPVVFVFGEVVPKNLFQLHADYLMGRASLPLSVAQRVCRATGIVWLLKGLAAGVNRLTGTVDTDIIATPRRRIASLLQEALADRDFGEEQSELVERVVQLSETPVHNVMVPRNRVTTIRAAADRKELVRIARRTGHARLPVFDTQPSHVVGTIRVDDLLRRDDWDSVDTHLQAVPALRPHATVATAIRSLQESRRDMAIVTDHGGRMLGIVTLTDLLEELVG